MFHDIPLLLLSAIVVPLRVSAVPFPPCVSLPAHAPSGAGKPLADFVSYSIELSSFPDYAGNLSSPNTYSYNMLKNIAYYAGAMPAVRVGGNTQDIAVFDASQEAGLVGTIVPSRSTDYPSIISIGPKFFDSYKTWPGIRFTHGLNLGNLAAMNATLESVSYACEAIGENLIAWEYGNEPDLYQLQQYRNASYTESIYVNEWHEGTRAIRNVLESACPQMATGAHYKLYAPSFAGVAYGDNGGITTLDPVTAWAEDLDQENVVGWISSHNYINIATAPGVTLQATLMNHTSTRHSLARQFNESGKIAALGDSKDPGVPFILGEYNSLAKQGKPGLSNSFGAALWGLDFNLYAAANNIARTHMHQGTNYRYQSWQPIATNITTQGTKAPYYGNIAVAASLGHITQGHTQVIELELSDELSSAYAVFKNHKLSKLVVIDSHEYNASDWNSNYTSHFTRPATPYSFQLPAYTKCAGTIQRLIANGSDALTGITFDGYSYNYELANGKPVLLRNVTSNEKVLVDKRTNTVMLGVPWSSAAIWSCQ